MTICEEWLANFISLRAGQEGHVSLLNFEALEVKDCDRGLLMCCGRDRSDCGYASGRGCVCVCEMGCGVVDWVMVGEKLIDVVCAKASAKLWSRDYESWHRASVSATVKALCGGYELVYERRVKVFLVLPLTKHVKVSELDYYMTRALTHDALAVTTKTTRVPLAGNLSFNRDNNDIRQPMALCSPATSRPGSPAFGS